jgi:competence protein ComEA
MQGWLRANGQVAPDTSAWRGMSMPGMLTAEQLARLDAARAAGALNLAARVNDGDQIRVPSRDDPANGQGGSGADSGAGGAAAGSAAGPNATVAIVHLNSATAAQLDALPGIGPVTAAKILASRDKQRFSAVDELKSRKLVGASTFEKIRDLVAVP